MPLEFIETHAHLTMRDYADDLNDVVKRAREAGIGRIITIGLKDTHNEETFGDAIRLAGRFDDMFATAAIHPHDAKIARDDDYEEAVKLASNAANKIAAIGEIGLDYHYDLSPRDVQREVFARFIEVAKRVNLPIIVHSREAFADTYDVMQACDAGSQGGIVHCYSYGADEARKFADLGFYFGVGGTVTYPKAQTVRDAVRAVGLSQIVLETDAPYLSPVPHRGRRNEPSYIPIIAAKIAETLGVSVEEVAAATTQNAKKVFPALR